MSDYIKATNFATKDTLSTGNPNKIIKGTEIDTEFNAVSNAIASKADINSPSLTGTPAAPTATAGSNTTQLANTAFVRAEITALSLGNMSTQTKSAVDITGGTVVGITDLAVADGGTGASTLAANNVLLGNGTSALQTVAPSTAGNVLTSNGTTWTSAAPPSSGVTSLNGQTGAITNTSLYAIGSYVTGRPNNGSGVSENATLAGSSLFVAQMYSVRDTCACNNGWFIANSSTTFSPPNTGSGTWRCVTACLSRFGSVGYSGLWVRIS